MNRFLTLVVLWVSGSALQHTHAQQIPNGTFENWTQTSSGLTLDGWTAFTGGIVRNNMPGGGFGLQMQTTAGPAASQAGCSFACSQRPLNFRFLGGYKRSLSTDQAAFSVFLFKSNAGIRDTIAYNQFFWNEQTATGNVIALVNKSFDLTYQAPGNPDSCEIRITHAVPSSGIQIGTGTILILDDVVFRDWATGNPLIPQPGLHSSVYPNPSSGHASLSFILTASGEVAVTMFNLQGQLVRTFIKEALKPGQYTLPLNVTGLPGGIYLLKLENHSGIQTHRFRINP